MIFPLKMKFHFSIVLSNSLNDWAINCQFGCCCSNSCQLTQFCRCILRLSDTFGHLLYELLRAWKFRNISFLFRSKNILPELFTNIAEHTNPSVMLQVKSRVRDTRMRVLAFGAYNMSANIYLTVVNMI